MLERLLPEATTEPLAGISDWDWGSDIAQDDMAWDPDARVDGGYEEPVEKKAWHSGRHCK